MGPERRHEARSAVAAGAPAQLARDDRPIRGGWRIADCRGATPPLRRRREWTVSTLRKRHHSTVLLCVGSYGSDGATAPAPPPPLLARRISRPIRKCEDRGTC